MTIENEMVVRAPGGVMVASPEGSFRRIETPKGFTDAMFWSAVAAFDTAFRIHGKLPSVDEVQKVYPRIPKKTLASLFITDEFKQALEYRGIEWDIDSGLSMEQNMVLLKLSDPFDRRSLAIKLKELRVPMPTFQNWLKNPLFREVYETQSISAYRDALPAIRNRVIGEAEHGERWAAELVFAKTGEWNPAAMGVENAAAVVQALVEAIIKHVGDAETRKAIMADVALSAGTLQAMSAPNNKALEV